MFEASLKAKRVEKGQSIEGAIVAIGDEVAFVNIGGKGEAQIELAELKNAEGVLELAVGDRIQATVIATEGGVVLSRKLALGAVAARQIEDAYHSHLAVEGKVEREARQLRDPSAGSAPARLAIASSGTPSPRSASSGPILPHHRTGGRQEPSRRAARCSRTNRRPWPRRFAARSWSAPC
jgi:hypothetical protein